MEFSAPDKYCPKCGSLMPTNGYKKDRKGNVLCDEHGHAEWRPNASLVCEFCAVAAMPPKPRERRAKGPDAKQESILTPDTATIEIR